MTNKNLKDLVEQIYKIANPPPPKKPGYVSTGLPKPKPAGTPTTNPAGAPATSPGGGARTLPGHGGTAPGGRTLPGHGGRSGQPGARPGGGGAVSNIDIMTLQHALQDLAQAVTAQINLQDANSGDPNKEKDAKARDAFGVFLTKNYMRNSKVPGVEFDPNPDVTKLEEKRPDDPTRLSVVMDTMNRVGNPKKGEKWVDGNWGPRTNAAIRNSFAFASGLFDFVDDINRFDPQKLKIQSYSKDRLKELEAFAQVDPNALKPADKARVSPTVTQHVKSIKAMYDEVKKNILQHPAYSRFIEGQDSFKNYDAKITQQQIAALKDSFKEGFNVKLNQDGSSSARILVDDLVSLDALNKWMSQVSKDKLDPNNIIQQIWAQQKQLLGSDPGY
jgi:hypothetical protein